MLITVAITNGPSREELFDGLRLFAEKRAVPFTLEYNRREILSTVYVDSIESADGIGEGWKLKLRIRKGFVISAVEENPFDGHPFFCDGTRKYKFLPVEAHFSTKTRRGIITFPEYI